MGKPLLTDTQNDEKRRVVDARYVPYGVFPAQNPNDSNRGIPDLQICCVYDSNASELVIYAPATTRIWGHSTRSLRYR